MVPTYAFNLMHKLRVNRAFHYTRLDQMEDINYVNVYTVYIFRHSKLEAALAEVNWRVRWDDIMFGAMEKKKLERSGSRMSLTRVC